MSGQIIVMPSPHPIVGVQQLTVPCSHDKFCVVTMRPGRMMKNNFSFLGITESDLSAPSLSSRSFSSLFPLCMYYYCRYIE